MAPCRVNDQPTTCVVVDTTIKGDWLNTRNIFNDEYGYTFKSYPTKDRLNENTAFTSYDSITGFEYEFPYIAEPDGYTRVSPHLAVKDISWD